MENQARVLDSLTVDWTTLLEVATQAQIHSVDVAVALQALRSMGVVESQGGLWRRCAAPQQVADVVVVVDLGNVHDCLQKIAPLAEAGQLQVLAYADLQYNGVGINPPFEVAGCTVFKATSPHKNAADTKMIWDIAQLCASSERPRRLLVTTKDNGFRYLRDLVEGSGHALSFAHDWASLRALLLPANAANAAPRLDAAARMS